MKYQYWRASKGAWAWHLKADNGQVVAQGKGYVRKSDMLHAIDLVKLSRPVELNVRQSRRYRLSFAALLAFGVAVTLSWLAAGLILPRWDASFVIVDAAVVHTEQVKTGRRQTETQSTTVKFTMPDGRIFTPTIKNSSVEIGATTVRIRYNPRDPNKVLEDSGTSTYFSALAFLLGAGIFLAGAYASSLHNEDGYFM